MGPVLRAVSFLLHFPSRRRDSPLGSTLPYGVRTFLRRWHAGDRLSYSDRSSPFAQKIILSQLGQFFKRSCRCISLYIWGGMFT